MFAVFCSAAVVQEVRRVKCRAKFRVEQTDGLRQSESCLFRARMRQQATWHNDHIDPIAPRWWIVAQILPYTLMDTVLRYA